MDSPNGTPRLLGPDGLPFERTGEARPAIGMSLPHGWSFIARYQGADYTYLHDRFDEAIRHSRTDADYMRNDCKIMSLLDERKMAVANLRWHLEVPDESDPQQVRVRDNLTRIIRAIPDLSEIIDGLLDALWYGKAAAQINWAWGEYNDRLPSREADLGGAAMGGMGGTPPRPEPRIRRCLTAEMAQRVNGDKIGYQEDGTPYVLVNPTMTHLLPNPEIILTNVGGAGLALTGTWRDRFIIHRHLSEDRDYFLGSDQALAIHGVGIRSKIFWWDYLRREWLANITEYFARVGLGLTIWRYPRGNAEAETEIRRTALQQSTRSHIFVPTDMDGSRGAGHEVQRIDAPTAGAEALLKLVQYADEAIKLYIVGQESSSKAGGAAGLGNEAATAFQQSTKENIARFDAGNLARTLTGTPRGVGLVSMVKRNTYPWAKFPVWWVFEVEQTGSQAKLSTAQGLMAAGLKIKADDLRMAGGFSKPTEGDETVGGAAAMPGMAPGMPGMPGALPPAAGGGDFLSAIQMKKIGAAVRYLAGQGRPDLARQVARAYARRRNG